MSAVEPGVSRLLILRDRSGALKDRARREALTREQLASCGVIAPAVNRRCHGCGSTEHGALHLSDQRRAGASRARSGQWHLFAASTSCSMLGVDIEHARRAAQARRALPRFCAAPELDGEGIGALRTFVRKEAILKARGTGFCADPRLQPTRAQRSAGEWIATADGWWLYERQIGSLLLCLAARRPHPVSITLAREHPLAAPVDAPGEPTRLC